MFCSFLAFSRNIFYYLKESKKCDTSVRRLQWTFISDNEDRTWRPCEFLRYENFVSFYEGMFLSHISSKYATTFFRNMEIYTVSITRAVICSLWRQLMYRRKQRRKTCVIFHHKYVPVQLNCAKCLLIPGPFSGLHWHKRHFGIGSANAHATMPLFNWFALPNSIQSVGSTWLRNRCHEKDILMVTW